LRIGVVVGDIGMLETDELEDEFELQDSKVRAEIAESSKDYSEGRTQPAQKLLAELKNELDQERPTE
jgi:hypothetical protein